MARPPIHIPVYLPDTRGVEIARYGLGNLKIGADVFTYSRRAGDPYRVGGHPGGTCPGSSEECEAICYAKRIAGPLLEVYERNGGNEVPPIPAEARILRLHISGDFDTVVYVENWIARLEERPDVAAWCYTRSWRLPRLLPALERLRALPNVELFASMDASIGELPPAGWRRAWIDGDPRAGAIATPERLLDRSLVSRTADGAKSLICLEEAKVKPDCRACGYCYGKGADVTFLRH